MQLLFWICCSALICAVKFMYGTTIHPITHILLYENLSKAYSFTLSKIISQLCWKENGVSILLFLNQSHVVYKLTSNQKKNHACPENDIVLPWYLVFLVVRWIILHYKCYIEAPIFMVGSYRSWIFFSSDNARTLVLDKSSSPWRCL
jgi:hypothetical protein